MMWINLFPLDDDQANYNTYLIFGTYDSALAHVVTTFIILFINLIVGCAITIFFIRIKGYLTLFIRFICCGFCDGCDCDYDGSQPSRSFQTRSKKTGGRSGRRRKSKNPGNYEHDEETIDCSCKACIQYLQIVTSYCVLKGRSSRRFRFYIFLMFGILFGLSTVDDELFVQLKEPYTLVHSFSSHSVFAERMDLNGSGKIYFITLTAASGIQAARLVRIAQALYRHRDAITWVIVSTDPKWYIESVDFRRTEHWTPIHALRWRTNHTRVMEHLLDLRKTVQRWGIPFVILSGHEIHHKKRGFPEMRMYEPERKLRSEILARYIGLLWTSETFSTGVIMVGNEDAAYNNQIFCKVRKTKIFSTWPTLSHSRNLIGLYTPVEEDGGAVSGYFDGRGFSTAPIPLMQLGNYAVSMPYARALLNRKTLWKLSITTGLTTTDLGIDFKDILPLGQNSTEIYVWKMIHTFSHRIKASKTKLSLNPEWSGSNIDILLEKIRKSYSMDLVFTKWFRTNYSMSERIDDRLI